MELWVDKVIAIIVTFTIPFVCTLLPLAMHGYIEKKGAQGQRIISYMMCFGGGIFFGTYMLHMGPEVRLILEESLFGPNDITYPVTDLVIGVGFFFVLFLEKIVMRISKRRGERKLRKQQKGCVVYQETLALGTGTAKLCSNCKEGETCVALEKKSICTSEHGFDCKKEENVGVMAVKLEVTEFRCCMTDGPPGDDCMLTCPQMCCDEVSIKKSGDVEDCCEKKADDKSSECSSESSDSHSHSHSHDHDHDHDAQGHHNMRSMILVLALSLHHLFEGLSVGLQESATLLWTLVLAVMCHESIISFSVGLNFIKCNYKMSKHIITALLVCLIMPVGEAIGIILTEVGGDSTALDIASGFLQAFSAGTFLFVTFFEIFAEEIDPHDTSIGKITSAFAGFVAMALLMMIPEGSPATVQDTTTVYMFNTTTDSLLYLGS